MNKSLRNKALQRGAIKPLIAVACLTGLFGLSSAGAVSLGDFSPWKSDKASEPQTEPAPKPKQPASVVKPAPHSATKPIAEPPPIPQADIPPPPEPIPEPDPLDQREQALMDAIEQARHEGGVDLNLISNLAQVRSLQAYRAADQGDLGAAMDHMLNALNLDEHHPLAARWWESVGDWASHINTSEGHAMAHYAWRQVTLLDTTHTRARLKLAELLMHRGQNAEALSYLESALYLQQDRPEWQHLMWAITLYLKTDQPMRGLDYLQSRLDDTGNESFLLAEAVLLDSQGQGEAAAQMAKRVADHDATPKALRKYAARLVKRFASAGDRRMDGQGSAGPGWVISKTGAGK